MLGRCVAAEIRSQMAARRISGKQLADLIGVSQNYLATRLRDEKPLSLDDVWSIAEVLGEDVDEFVSDACKRQWDVVWDTVPAPDPPLFTDLTAAADARAVRQHGHAGVQGHAVPVP